MKLTIKLSSGLTQEGVIHKNKAIIGRSMKCDLVVPEDLLSRTHCLIEFVGGEFFVTDLESANGVFIDQDRISPHIRMPFKTYQLVHLGPLELTVADSDLSKSDLIIDHRELEQAYPLNNHSRSSSKKPQGVNPPKSKQPLQPRERNYTFLLSIVTFLSILGYLGYEVTMKPKKLSSVDPSGNAVALSSEFLHIKDEFLSASEYQSVFEKKTCISDPDICAEIKLFESQGEGVVARDNEFFVFIRSSKAAQPRYEKIKDDEKLKLVFAIDTIIRTHFFELFKGKNIGQIHLVLVDDNLKLSKVIRFHTKNFSRTGHELLRLRSSLHRMLHSGESPEFEKDASIVKLRTLI